MRRSLLLSACAVLLATAAQAQPAPPVRGLERVPATRGLSTDTVPGLGQGRVALVVGNNAYAPLGALENPRRDAQLIAEGLKDAGFTKVIEANDLSRAAFAAKLAEFKREADGAEVALIYFAGHGFEVDRVNYIAPVDAAVRALKDIPDQFIPLDQLKATVGGAGRVKILVLDACRKDDFTKAFAGQSGIRVGNADSRASDTGLIVAFSAAEGQYASDGDAGASNSPFADALARRLATPGVEIGNLFRLVHDDVRAATAQEQSPAFYASLSGDNFYLIPPPVEAPGGIKVADTAAKTEAEIELEFWKAVTEIGDADLYQVYLDKVAAGEFSGRFKPIAAVKVRASPTRAADAPAPVVAASTKPATGPLCVAGGKVDVLENGTWYPSVVRAAAEADGRCPIHYDGFDAKYDESVGPERLRAYQPAPPLTEAQKADTAEAKALVAAGQADVASGDFLNSAVKLEKASRVAGRVPNLRGIAAATALLSGANYLTADKNPARSTLRAARMFKRAADFGDAGGAVAYAYMLRTGHGVARDDNRARGVLRPFAEAGDAQAMAQYGQMLLLGQGGARDADAGRRYIEKSALAGSSYGMRYWGDLVRRDRGDVAAADWYRKAAEKGNTKAMLALGRLLLWSDTLPRDPEAGKTWLKKAGDEFEFDALYELARLYTNDRDPKVQAEGAALAQRAALSLNADHAIFYAGLLERGVGTTRDLKAARTWYENAALNGNRYQKRRAQLELASLPR